MKNAAIFSVGELIQHRNFDYRGVVVDIDPVFLGSQTWFEQMAHNHETSHLPWYRILVDEGFETYVSESQLLRDLSGEPVENPGLCEYFSGFNQGRYVQRHRIN